jgi:hypothetical protein
MGERYNIKDYSGQRYGKLLVICDTGEKQYSPSGCSKRIWLLKCDCGNKIKITTQSLVNWNNKTNKENINCGCHKKQGVESIAKEIWKSEYSDGDISFNQFLWLSQQNCFHCNSNVQNSGSIKIRKSKKKLNNKSFKYHGLDRIDNEKGHFLSNVVPCCAPCNFLRGKRNLFSFLNHIFKIVNNYHNMIIEL